MKRLVALCLAGLACLAAWTAVQAAEENPAPVAVAAGWAHVAPEHTAALLRALHGSSGRAAEGLALALPGPGDGAWAAVDSAGGLGSANPLRVWASPYFISPVHNGEAGYSNDAFGIVVGADKTFGAFTLGLAGNLMTGDYNARGDFLKNDYHGLSGTLFGRFTCGHWSVEGDLGYGRLWGRTVRGVPDSWPDSWTARSRLAMRQYLAAIAAAYRFDLGYDWTLTPSLGIQYTYARLPARGEDGASAYRLSYLRDSHNWVRTPLMLTAARAMRGYGHLFTPYLRAGATHEWHHDRPSRHVYRAANPAGGAAGIPGRFWGARPVHWYGQAGAGFTVKAGMRTDITAGYDFEFGHRYHNNVINLGVGFSF